jgi:hypothetical protein
MIPHRFPAHAASQHAKASAFDRLTFTACMVTIAVFLAVVADTGPVAAVTHIAEVLRAAATLPDASGDLYAATMMPF